MPRPVASRSVLIVSALLAGSTLAVRALGTAAQSPAERMPGAVGNVAGHVPDQLEQAQTAPVEASRSKPVSDWWSPGEGRRMPPSITYANGLGQLGMLNTAAPFETKGHPFFEAVGANGRACVTCHQPANAMSVSAEAIQKRWQETKGKDPIFAAVDGKNCPDLPQDDPASHSLLLKRGLFRIFLPWPPRAADGKAIDPEFTIEVVRDPTGCNLSPVYGLRSANPMISVYRRPRVVANVKYLEHQKFGVGPFIGKNGLPSARDPETGKPVAMNIMADAREPTLKTQAVEAAITHLQFDGKLDAAALAKILAFERQVYTAQTSYHGAGSLIDADGPPAFGPANLAREEEGVLGNNTTRFVFPMGDAWKVAKPGESAEQRAMRDSIRRGHDVFFYRTFWIRDSMHLNELGLGNPTKRTCATCHGMHMTGMDVADGWMDIGTTNLPWAKDPPISPWETEKPELPLFKISCKPGVPPHPFLGRVILTHDPGRALISGRCADVGAITMQQWRGLSARAPYFSNGSARTLKDLVEYYDKRFDIRYTDREKEDLVNFLSVL